MTKAHAIARAYALAALAVAGCWSCSAPAAPDDWGDGDQFALQPRVNWSGRDAGPVDDDAGPVAVVAVPDAGPVEL